MFISNSVIFLTIDSVFRTGKNYYPQVLLEEFKSVIKGKKIPKYISDDIEISSDSDEENSDEEILIKTIQIEKNCDYEENSDEEILVRNSMTKDEKRSEIDIKISRKKKKKNYVSI